MQLDTRVSIRYAAIYNLVLFTVKVKHTQQSTLAACVPSWPPRRIGSLVFYQHKAFRYSVHTNGQKALTNAT